MNDSSTVHRDKRLRDVRKRHSGGDASAARTGFWLYGTHAARAALANARRVIHRIVVTERARIELAFEIAGRRVEVLPPDQLARLLPPGAVHQGVALRCEPLPNLSLQEALGAGPLSGDQRRIVTVLDQITDPQNEGAILRSAAAFAASALLVQVRHAPPESGAMAKAASGALDRVPRVRVVNIARALEEIGRLGFLRIALAADGDCLLSELEAPRDVALVLGAEGSGLRRLVRERCDVSASIPISSAMASLNVSVAAAVAMYELRRQPTKARS